MNGHTATTNASVSGSSSYESAHTHPITVSTPYKTMSTQDSTGGDSPHENKPAYLSVFYIMRIR